MTEFLLADFNTGFAIALGMVIALALLEGIGTLIGLSLMGLLDNISPIDIDLDLDVDVTNSGITPLLGWLCLNKLPLLVWLVLFLSCFGIVGFTLNFVSLSMLGSLMPDFAIYVTSLLIAVFLTHLIGQPLARLLPKNESTAISNNSFEGLIARITIGTATKNSPAEAVLTDNFNQKHYVLIVPDNETERFKQGDRVVLVEKQDNIWLSVKFEQ